MTQDEKYMSRAIRLARKGAGWVSPNPMVGAVIVDENGRIVSEGFHERFGGPHAERVALEKLNFNAKGCTLYVNLEPCCHYGKTPPCTQAIIKSGIKRVVVGMADPNPLVSGRGIEILRNHGIEVVVGVLEERCRELNRAFIKWITRKIPYVTLKWAQSLDGKIATKTGDSRWISSEKALKFAHRLRALHDAVLVGKRTVEKDDPMLNVRLVRGRDPLRVVLDADLSLPPDRKVFSVPPETVVFTASGSKEKEERLKEKGVEVIRIPESEGKLSIKEVLKTLGERGITSLLVEGGSQTHASFIKEGLYDEIQAVVAPKIIGSGIEAAGIEGINRVEDAVKLRLLSARRLGEDVVIVLRPLES
ncbi:MAG: bifunctional diaminohydroxyphosphoribosylaminopyrimidine deaminase/5-amino-6-(5-phosphoribosylamino)uracil reductase RibD [Deferribacteres bacterium]|nr:bifunctional diaminohydroxyphosphoribosylaminopyrimidine deaminase/5-amino-6-(5-phosphoribosylamino)uracil reductase RibD [Deferribacteres bacterium]